MAAPANKTIRDLNGKWVMNKTLSDSLDGSLALQGIGFLLRKTIGLASISIEVTQYEAAPKPPSTASGVVTHVDIAQSASGLSSTQERRCLDDVAREHTDWLFGTVESRSRWVARGEVADAFLAEGWVLDEGKGEGEGEGEGEALIRTQAVSRDNGWTTTQVWGFQMVQGQRRHCRRAVTEKEGKRVEFRMVYDYVG